MKETSSSNDFSREIDRLRKAMAFKYGKEIASVAVDTVEELSVVLEMKANAYKIRPMRLLRCVSDTLAGMICGVDAKAAEIAKQREQN